MKMKKYALVVMVPLLVCSLPSLCMAAKQKDSAYSWGKWDNGVAPAAGPGALAATTAFRPMEQPDYRPVPLTVPVESAPQIDQSYLPPPISVVRTMLPPMPDVEAPPATLHPGQPALPQIPSITPSPGPNLPSIPEPPGQN